MAQKEVKRLQLLRNYLYKEIGSEHYDQSIQDYSLVESEIKQFSELNKETKEASLNEIGQSILN